MSSDGVLELDAVFSFEGALAEIVVWGISVLETLQRIVAVITRDEGVSHVAFSTLTDLAHLVSVEFLET
jgi:hypothetical protein